MNNCGSKGRRTFVLLRELRGACVVSGCTGLRESLHLYTCQNWTKDVCPFHPDQRTSIPRIRADSDLSQPRHSLFPAKCERPEGVYYAKHEGHVNILPVPSSYLLPSAICVNFRPGWLYFLALHGQSRYQAELWVHSSKAYLDCKGSLGQKALNPPILILPLGGVTSENFFVDPGACSEKDVLSSLLLSVSMKSKFGQACNILRKCMRCHSIHLCEIRTCFISCI